MHTIIVFILSVLIKLSAAADSSCSIQLTELPSNEPTYSLRGHSGLYEPSNGKIEISSTDKLDLFCPGSQNNIIKSSDNTAEVSCDNNFRKKLHQLNCVKQVTGDLQPTTKPCTLNDRHGVIYRVGFANGKTFSEIFQICYDVEAASPLYTHHEINGKAIEYHIKESRRVNFKTDGVPKPAKAEVNYRKKTQINRFKILFGQNQRYFSDSSFLARGHLTPDADFVFRSGQFATYFYANVCPEFQSINGGNWLHVENTARNLAAQEQTFLQIYTGIYRKLMLPTSTGDLLSLYLSEVNLIEVPAYIWKIVYNPHTDAAIVFITSNNPFARRGEINELCSDVCEQSGISFPQATQKGLTICCTYESFTRFITIQQKLNVKQLLVLRHNANTIKKTKVKAKL